MTGVDRVFVDTNLLLAATDPSRATHQAAQRFFRDWPAAGVTLVASGQVAREYLAVATRPRGVNGLGLTPAQALGNLREFGARMHFFDEDGRVRERLFELVARYGVAGKQVHDANIVATMLAEGVRALVTLNAEDFRRFDGEVELVRWVET